MKLQQQLRSAQTLQVVGRGLCGLLLFLVFGIVLSDSTYAATNSSITVGVSQATASLDIAPADLVGTFANSGTDIAFSVTTTNFTGYNLSITASSDGDNAANLVQEVTRNAGLANEENITRVIESLGEVEGMTNSGISESVFSNSSNTQYNNKWGFKPNKLNSIDNSNYLPAPVDTSDSIVLDTPTTAGTNNYTINIGARVNTAIPSGMYTNTLVITAVANMIEYEISYDKGATEDTVTNLPTSTTGVIGDPTTDSTNVTLAATTPSRSGYSFNGWCTANPTAGANGGPDTCGGTTYAASSTYILDATANPNITLYALWKKPTLYDKVAAMSKGKQTLAQLQATITVPTSADRTEDTSNSGVYEYDSSVFGTASDASNTSKIYYYRGVLENAVGSYGSDGSAVTYPNYVVLSSASSKASLATTDTCWRIVRTTGSGGVKMIYNGKWTGSTCANATTNAYLTTKAFNGTFSTRRQMVRVGYTYNSTYATNTAQSGTIAQIFGTNSTPSVNNTRSTIKQYIEDTWYAGNMTAYTSILEPSAGYCNDRTMNTTTSWTTPLTEDSTIAATYGTSGLQVYYFGAYVRNVNSAQKPSLTCAKYSNVDRSTVDLYRYNGTNNAAGSTTANYLKYPAALLTADELSFAGSGSSTATNGSSYNANSYLRSGSYFWLLSPACRNSDGNAYGFYLSSDGYLSNFSVYSTYGVRPAISLKPGTTATSGTGIATDPWVVTAP